MPIRPENPAPLQLTHPSPRKNLYVPFGGKLS